MNSINSMQKNIQQIENFFSQEHPLKESAEYLLNLFNSFPSLLHEQKYEELLSKYIDNVYSRKGLLSEEQQKRITDCFYAIHHLTVPEVVIIPKQKYPIPISLLPKEDLKKSYFEPLTIKLGDGSSVIVSRGMLAYYSKMVQALINNHQMKKNAHELVLSQLNAHQFDVLMAYLQTGLKTLIHEDNILAFLAVADYMEMPQLLNACKEFLSIHIDGNNFLIADLLNLLKPKRDKDLITELENRISKIFSNELSKKPISPQFLEFVAHFKEVLKSKITLSLMKSKCDDDNFNHLKNLPLEKLQIMECNNLTSQSIALFEDVSLNEIRLLNNRWVNDETLTHIKKCSKFSLSGSRSVTRQGLLNLQNVKLNSLELVASHLQDADFAELPLELESLNLRLCPGVGKETVKRIGQMKNLHRLILANTPIKDVHIPFLPKQLSILDLTGCMITDKSADAISQMSDLKELYLSGINISDNLLAKLPTSLERLHLSNCAKVSNNAIELFEKRNNFKYLHLTRMPHITNDAIEKFSDTNISVEWQGSSPANPSTWPQFQHK